MSFSKSHRAATCGSLPVTEGSPVEAQQTTPQATQTHSATKAHYALHYASLRFQWGKLRNELNSTTQIADELLQQSASPETKQIAIALISLSEGIIDMGNLLDALYEQNPTMPLHPPVAHLDTSPTSDGYPHCQCPTPVPPSTHPSEGSHEHGGFAPPHAHEEPPEHDAVPATPFQPPVLTILPCPIQGNTIGLSLKRCLGKFFLAAHNPAWIAFVGAFASQCH